MSVMSDYFSQNINLLIADGEHGDEAMIKWYNNFHWVATQSLS